MCTQIKAISLTKRRLPVRTAAARGRLQRARLSKQSPATPQDTVPVPRMSSQLRERKKGKTGRAQPSPQEEEDTKKPQEEPVDLEPNIYVAIGIMLLFAMVLGIFIYYKVDQRNNGPFASFVNDNILPKNRYQKVG